MSKKLDKPVHLHIISTEDALAELDLWRSRHVPTATRSDAIRRIFLGLNKGTTAKSEQD